MGRRLKGVWLRFLQNAEQLDHRGLPCNVEDYINDDTVTHGPGNAQLAELIPSLLTSLGILGTFMGMTSGLSGLDPTSTEAMMSGIKTLLAGMQFAFGTSVAGVSCSLVFNMVNRIAQGSSYRAIDDFVESFTQLAMQRPLDNDVQLICQNQDRNHLLNTVTDTLSNTMSASIEGAISRAMQPVTRSMDDFLVGATRAQVDGVGRIVNAFVTRMNASLDDQLLSLAHTLSDLNQQQQISSQQLQLSQQSAAQIIANVQQVNGMSKDMLAHFEHYIAELTDARRRDERFEVNVNELLARLREASDQQVVTIGQLRQGQEQLFQAMSQYVDVTQKSAAQVQQMNTDQAALTARTLEHMDEAGASAAKASLELSHSYERFVKDAVDGLDRSHGLFDRSLNDAIEALSAQVKALAEAQPEGTSKAESLGQIERLLAQIERTLKDGTKEG